MKRKTFELDAALADEFEAMCKTRGLVEKSVVAALLRYFVRSDPVQRERIMLEGLDDQTRANVKIAAKTAGKRHFTRASNPQE